MERTSKIKNEQNKKRKLPEDKQNEQKQDKDSNKKLKFKRSMIFNVITSIDENSKFVGLRATTDLGFFNEPYEFVAKSQDSDPSNINNLNIQYHNFSENTNNINNIDAQHSNSLIVNDSNNFVACQSNLPITGNINNINNSEEQSSTPIAIKTCNKCTICISKCHYCEKNNFWITIDPPEIYEGECPIAFPKKRSECQLPDVSNYQKGSYIFVAEPGKEWNIWFLRVRNTITIQDTNVSNGESECTLLNTCTLYVSDKKALTILGKSLKKTKK